MPVYLFKSVEDESKILEMYFSYADAPPIGSLIEDSGSSWMRIPSFQISDDVQNVVHKYPYVSSALPKNIGDCEKTKGGKPIIQSRAHERNICAKYGFVRE